MIFWILKIISNYYTHYCNLNSNWTEATIMNTLVVILLQILIVSSQKIIVKGDHSGKIFCYKFKKLAWRKNNYDRLLKWKETILIFENRHWFMWRNKRYQWVRGQANISWVSQYQVSSQSRLRKNDSFRGNDRIPRWIQQQLWNRSFNL